MRSSSVLILLFLTTVLSACQLKSSSDELSEVLLASEPEMAQELEASFLSDQQSFAYTLHYDGGLMQIVDGQFEGAGVVGPSFSVLGGAEIVVQSKNAADVLDFPALKNPPEQFNGLTVYHSTSQEGACSVETSVLPVSLEALVLTVKVCDGEDAQAAQEAFGGLLKALELRAL